MSTMSSALLPSSPSGRGQSPFENAFQGLSLSRFVQVRWLCSLTQAGILVLGVLLDPDLPWPVMAVLIGSGAASNLLLSKLSHPPRIPWALGAILWDVVVLTALLALSGGPTNPFSVVYLIYITLAALVLNQGALWMVVTISVTGYGLLFFLPGETIHMHHGEPNAAFSAHLQGMWTALTITACVIAGSVARLTKSLGQEREQRARATRLLGLTTLAAGAAHELGNPLGTIKIAASELLEEVDEKTQPSWSEDLETILDEVDRARGVIDRLGVAAGELAGEGSQLGSVGQLISSLEKELGKRAESVSFVSSHEEQPIQLPLQATVQALLQLIRNGIDASPGKAAVEVSAKTHLDTLQVSIKDRGPGMDRLTQERFVEPFFTTKPPGGGMGLGAFLAHTFVTQLGGELLVNSIPGQGTTIKVILPREAK